MVIPQHVALILDGNGRWAKKRGLPRTMGHKEGCVTVEKTVEIAARMGIRYLTVYGFSTENWKRSAEEVGALMQLFRYYMVRLLKIASANNVRVRMIGDRSRFAADIIEGINRLESQTKDNTGLTFVIAVNYGGRDEIRRAAARLAKELGITVSLDACSMQEDNEKNWELASLADILIANEKYPRRLTGKDSVEEALAVMAKLGPKVLASTAGSRGCWYVRDGCVKHLPAFEIRAVDTTGAGDTFHGAFLACWLTRPDPEYCLRFASAAAALKCLKRGGRAGIPDRAAAEAFLSRNGAVE